MVRTSARRQSLRVPLRRRDPVVHAALRASSERQGGVVSRRELYARGVTRWEVRAHVHAGRWQTIGDQSVALHSGPVTLEGWRWAAVFQGGPRAHLDGSAALVASGLQRLAPDRIRVSVPRGARVRRTSLFDIRQTRRWDPGALAGTGVPRSVPAVAAVRAALWARSDRQAALLLTMTVQQGLARTEEVAQAALAVRRDRRKALVHTVCSDLLGGVRSLGELDLARGCRRRGLPEPTRQVVRRGPRGRLYLDALWEEWRVVVEVDGIQHGWVENALDDALRHNEVALTGQVVLRLPVLGLRVSPDAFYDQVARALRDAGWSGPS